MNKTQLKALLASYLRSVLGAGVALYLSGVTDPTKLVYALLAALLPVAIRYINPKDKAFGVVPSADVVDAAVNSASVEAGLALKKQILADLQKSHKAEVAKAAGVKATVKPVTKKPSSGR